MDWQDEWVKLVDEVMREVSDKAHLVMEDEPHLVMEDVVVKLMKAM